MRKKWKQGMAAALSALMLLGLAGCGDNGDAGQASGGAESKPSTEESSQVPAEEEQADSGQADVGQEESTELEVVKILGRNYTYTGANGKTVTLKDWATEGKSKRFAKLEEELAKKGVTTARTFVGNYMTSIDMAGYSVSLLKLDDELKKYLNAPADTPAFVQV